MDRQLKPALKRLGRKNKPASPQEQSVPPVPEDDEPLSVEEMAMGFLDHLSELRDRLIRAVIGLGITTLLAFLFADRFLQYLMTPITSRAEDGTFRLQTLGPTEGVIIYFRVALLVGAIVAIPWLTWQVWMFIAPGLTKREKRYILMSIPATTLLFIVGVMFCWFVMMPAALGFLLEFQTNIFDAGWTAGQYVAFVTSLLFWIGVAFEMPLVFFILARMGMVTPRTLLKNWRLAVVATALAAALITPTVDPFNMMIVMGPLLALYGLSIVLAAIAYRQTGLAEKP